MRGTGWGWNDCVGTVVVGRFALERLSRREDGLYVYRMKKAKPNGSCELVLTGVQLLKKLTALVPPPKVNLVRFLWRLRTRLQA